MGRFLSSLYRDSHLGQCVFHMFGRHDVDNVVGAILGSDIDTDFSSVDYRRNVRLLQSEIYLVTGEPGVDHR